MSTSTRSELSDGLRSAAVGAGVGLVVTVAVAAIYDALRPTAFEELVTFTASGFVVALLGCAVVAVAYWSVRDRRPDGLDYFFVGSFGLTVGIAVFVWRFAPIVDVVVKLLVSDPLGLPVGIFLLMLYFLGALAFAIPALVLALLAGVLATGAVSYAFGGDPGKRPDDA